MGLAAFAVVVGLLIAPGVVRASADTVRLTVVPRVGLLDAGFGVRVAGLQARERVTVRVAEPAVPRGGLAVSRTIRADRHGVAVVSGPSLLGLLQPTPGTPADAAPHFSQLITVTATVNRRRLATAQARRFVAPASVAIADERLAQTGLYGEYFRPSAPAAHAAVLLIGGSGGGLPNGYAAGLLASHGFPVLSLAYFGEPGLPSELQRIPLEYFQHALEWLARQPEVDPERVAIVGVSRGGEAALLIGSSYPALVRAVAAYVPSANVNPSPLNRDLPAWTIGGSPIPNGPIALEQIAGPVFAVGAADDHLWPSSSAVMAIQQRLNANGKHDATVLDYPRAGHGVGAIVPNLPTHPIVNSRYGTLDLGGTPAADETARENSWPKLLNFLAHI
jgi:dienelactone hydrolase